MINLIIGDNQTRDSQNDADIFSAVFGDTACVLPYGDLMNVSVVDNNTVRVSSGLMSIEGRAVQIVAGDYEDFVIPTGMQGVDSTYYIGFRIYRDSFGEHVEKYVGVVNPQQGSIRSGDAEMYGIIASIPLAGINIGTPIRTIQTMDKPIAADNSKIITAVGSKIVRPKASAADFLLFTDDELRDLTGYNLSESDIMARMVVTVSNGHYESNKVFPISTARRVPRKEQGETYEQGIWVKLNTATSSPFRVTYSITAKVG